MILRRFLLILVRVISLRAVVVLSDGHADSKGGDYSTDPSTDLAMELLFGIGYAGITFEESLAFNKSGVGLLMAVSLWVIKSIGLRD
ncbi:hypothetical protein Hdeb2414_s0006g00215461 [Helianthus debilis subsp. tardiflorus]